MNNELQHLKGRKKLAFQFYPETRKDPDFGLKLLQMREFNQHEIPEKHLEKLDDFNTTVNKKCDIATITTTNEQGIPIEKKIKLKKEEDDEGNAKHELYETQRLLRNFISPFSNYNSLLIYHGVGVGKTCAALVIEEQFLKTIIPNKQSVHIISSKSITNQIKDKIKGKECSENKELRELSQHYFGISKIEDILGNTKTRRPYHPIKFHTFDTFLKKFEKKNTDHKEIDLYNLQELDNTVIIIDELHNIREEQKIKEPIEEEEENEEEEPAPEHVLEPDSEEQQSNPKDKPKRTYKKKEKYEEKDVPFYNKLGDRYIKLFEAMKENNINCKLILMSATPLFDNIKELLFIVNLLSLNDKENKLTKAEETLEDKEAIIKKLIGKVSYLRSNPITFPRRLYPKETNNLGYKIKNLSIDGHKTQITIVYSKINYAHYKSIQIQEDLGEEELVEGERKKIERKKIERHHSNVFEDKHHPKISTMIDFIKQSHGMVLVYSAYIDKGINIIERELTKPDKNKKVEYVEYDDKNKTNSDYDYKRYLKISAANVQKLRALMSDKNSDNKNIIKGEENIDGKLIKIIIGTDVLSEGLDFSYIRSIHILEPWYNLSKIEQIIGRGCRNCSHPLLPFEHQNVTIFLHSTMYEDAQHIEHYDTIDAQWWKRSVEKQLKLNEWYVILRSIALDCNLNKHGNLFINNLPRNVEMTNCLEEKVTIDFNDQDYSYDCFFGKCAYKCDPDYQVLVSHAKKEITALEMIKENSIETFYTKEAMRPEIDHYISLIKQLYGEKNIAFDYPTILNYIILIDKLNEQSIAREEIHIAFALQTMLEEEIPLQDIYQRNGKLIYRGKYYIFFPETLDEGEYSLDFIKIPQSVREEKINIKQIELYEGDFDIAEFMKEEKNRIVQILEERVEELKTIIEQWLINKKIQPDFLKMIAFDELNVYDKKIYLKQYEPLFTDDYYTPYVDKTEMTNRRFILCNSDYHFMSYAQDKNDEINYIQLPIQLETHKQYKYYVDCYSGIFKKITSKTEKGTEKGLEKGSEKGRVPTKDDLLMFLNTKKEMIQEEVFQNINTPRKDLLKILAYEDNIVLRNEVFETSSTLDKKSKSKTKSKSRSQQQQRHTKRHTHK